MLKNLKQGTLHWPVASHRSIVEPQLFAKLEREDNRLRTREEYISQELTASQRAQRPLLAIEPSSLCSLSLSFKGVVVLRHFLQSPSLFHSEKGKKTQITYFRLVRKRLSKSDSRRSGLAYCSGAKLDLMSFPFFSLDWSQWDTNETASCLFYRPAVVSQVTMTEY